MMSEEMIKQMPHLMTSGASQMLPRPAATGAMLAGAGFAAGRGLLLRNPLLLLAAGVAGGIAAGFLLHKYQKEIVDGVGKLGGMGRDFALHQKENLADLMAEAEEKLAGDAPAPASAPREPAA